MPPGESTVSRTSGRNPPGAIVVGAHVNGLGIVRSLGRRGIPVAVISTRPFDVAHHSRWAGERHALPALHGHHESLVDLLERNAARWRGWAVFPSNDDALTALACHHERLSRSYRLPLGPWEEMGPLVDKDRMHGLAVACGLDVPSCYGNATPATAARGDLRFPLVVKPVQHDRLISRFGTKLFVARQPRELLAACERLAEVSVPGLVYELVPGPDDHIYVDCVYLDARGEPVAGVTVRKLRQSPPGVGGARVAEVVPDDKELRDATVALLRRAGFRGMAFAEYKRDARSGRFRFIEVNARAVLFNGLLPPTGVDLVHLAWRDFVLGEDLRVQRRDWAGVWIHLQADLLGSLFYRHAETLSLAAFLAPYRRPKTFAVWSASDPRPFAVQTARLAGDARAALLDRARRTALRRRLSGAMRPL